MTEVLVDLNWEVVSAAGKTVATFDSEEAAKAYLKSRNAEPGKQLPGAYVDCVETVITRRRVYTPRLKLVA